MPAMQQELELSLLVVLVKSAPISEKHRHVCIKIKIERPCLRRRLALVVKAGLYKGQQQDITRNYVCKQYRVHDL